MPTDQVSSPTTTPPKQDLVKTISHLVDRIASLETHLHQATPMDTCSHTQGAYMTERTRTQSHSRTQNLRVPPSHTKDFFRNPLPEVERRRFPAECPRNMERGYTPPTINSINVSQWSLYNLFFRYRNVVSERNDPIFCAVGNSNMSIY